MAKDNGFLKKNVKKHLEVLEFPFVKAELTVVSRLDDELYGV